MVKYCEIFEMEFEMVFIEPLRRTEQNKLRIFLDLGDLYTNAIPCSRRYVREFSMTHISIYIIRRGFYADFEIEVEIIFWPKHPCEKRV